MKQPYHAIFGALLLENLAEESKVFENIMLKNQDLFHRSLTQNGSTIS
jgi:hypothetical protein